MPMITSTHQTKRRRFRITFLLLAVTVIPSLSAQDLEQEETAVGELFFEEDRDYMRNPLRPSEVAPSATDETAARIIDLHLQARGGRDKLEAIESLLFEGTLVEGPADYHALWRLRPPHQFRFDRFRSHLGWDYHTAWVQDGKTFWTQQFLPEKGQPRSTSRESVLTFAYNPDIFTPLLRHQEAGHLFAYDGEGKVKGAPVYIVKGKLKDGPIVFYYFDQTTFLIRNIGFRDDFAGSPVNIDRLPTGIRRINGVWLETGFRYVVNGRTYRLIRYGRVSMNDHFREDLFEKPEVKEVWLRGENAFPGEEEEEEDDENDAGSAVSQ